jgi:ADP-ribose pyrophosphatase
MSQNSISYFNFESLSGIYMLFRISLIFVLSFLTPTSVAFQKDDNNSLNSYFKYLERYRNILGPMGNAQNGEIEIIQDKKKIAEIEKMTGRKVGTIAEDKYWIWLNDAVQFPNKKQGVYGRLLWVNSLNGPPGVVIMAILPNGKIVLNRNFRHATRSWEYELPRGARNPNETIEEAAIREVKEETGMEIKDLQLLGNIAPDSGVLNTIEPVFLAKVLRQGDSQREDSEAIAGIEAFSVAELKKGFVDGYLIVSIDNQKHKIPLRDPFLAYALLLAEIKQYIKS